jgi:ATP-dependent helicase/nuclease subunit B
MAKFTDKVASYIFENELYIQNLVVILPSERAKKYLTASLYDVAGKPIFSPQLVTIDQWISSLSNRTIVDRTRVLLRLYEIYLVHHEDTATTSFDEFMSWGATLLSDFEEIDRYMLPSKEVFRNLRTIHELESWSFLTDELTEGQKKFLEFWEKLPLYYETLNQRLDEERICYAGSAYAWVANNIDVVFREHKERVFLFAGFNALSASEQSIMKQLYRMGKAHILIDADTFYLNDTTHEAGRFLRELMEALEVKTLPFIANEMAQSTISVEVIECAQRTGQVKVASSLLASFSKEELNETLVLLADEQLIAPLVRNLPKHIEKANITLGLPLQHTALKTWVDLLFSIQENRGRFKTHAIYIYDLQRFWNHPFSLLFFHDDEKKAIVALEQQFIRTNSIFIRKETVLVASASDELIQLVFRDWSDDWSAVVHTFRAINALLYSRFSDSDDFEKAIIETFEKGLIDFENLLLEGLPPLNLKSFKLLFTQHWARRALAYHGNPLEGVQIMGLLETRLLDFKQCIVLGLNEGTMPPTNPIQTMIPMDLRHFLKLPTPREKQGLFANHFYRLMHHCEHLWITFTASSETFGSNEESRYIRQMELEWSRINKQMHFQRSFYTVDHEERHTDSSVCIQKTTDILQRLDAFFQKPVSASALNKYIACPLDFYYRYLLEFGEEQSVEEEIENNTFGTFIHNVLERLYSPFARHDKAGLLKTPAPSNITVKDIDGMLQRYQAYMTEEFMLHFNNDAGAFKTGRNLLSFRMACQLTERVLKDDRDFLSKQTAPVFIEYIEVELKGVVNIELNGAQRTVSLRGFIDRIDSIGDRVRIIDYKSGKATAQDVELTKLDTSKSLVLQFSSKKHAVQLSMYTYLYHQTTGTFPSVTAIYPLVSSESTLVEFKVKKATDYHELIELFPLVVQEVLTDLYNTELPFLHTEATYKSYCQYCN